MPRRKKREPLVLETCLLETQTWQEGYQQFRILFGKPLGWMYLHEPSPEANPSQDILIRLDRKTSCSYYHTTRQHVEECENCLHELARTLCAKGDFVSPNAISCAGKRPATAFPLRHVGQVRGCLMLCNLAHEVVSNKPLLGAFQGFLDAQVGLAYRTYELNNFYETVHPRALALSTMHSVHRVISSSLNLDELIPRVARLSAQVLKAESCSIMLVDEDRKHLIPKFSMGEGGSKIRLKIGRGIEGRVVSTGEFHFDRNCIALPLIEDDVIGVITLSNKKGRTPFTRTDLEILKTLSEQAVIAIKNAQLYEEAEAITLGSIKSINDILQMSYKNENVHLPLFAKLVTEIGKELKLNSSELKNLERAVHLLDTGHIGMAPEIFLKSSKLTKREMNQIKTIPHRGVNILKSIRSLKPVMPIILYHRERYDGSGYPDHLAGNQIPVGARIVALADAFTAMIEERPYRKGKSIEVAVREIKELSGKQFDPGVVEAFLKTLERPEIVEMAKNAASKAPSEGGAE